ncbi:MAG: hypothetical protein AAB835_02690 [Patescibacteria group bacterium]
MVIFALGYKYDFVQKRFFKTGSLELRSNISVEVYINDELSGGTSFLTNSFSKGRLLPRTYRVRAQKDGYQPWQKLIKVEAGFLASFPKVVLIPETFQDELVASSSIGNISIRKFDASNSAAIIGNKQRLQSINLKTGEIKQIEQPSGRTAPSIGASETNYVSSPDEEKTVWFNERELWIKWEKDASYQPFQKVGDVEFVTRLNQKIDDVQWYRDSGNLLISVGGILKFAEIDNRGEINIFDITTIAGPFYYDSDIEAIFKFEKNKLLKIRFE